MDVKRTATAGESRSDLVGRLSRYIENEVLDGEDVALDLDTPLLKLGIIDSIELVGLLAFIEDELGMELDTAQLKPEDFESIGAVARFLEMRNPGSKTAAPETAMASQWVRLAEDTELHLLRRSAHDGAGVPWLCLPALGTTAASWSPLVRVVHPEQEVVAVDLAGFGLSRSTRSELSFRDHVEMISTFLTLHVEERICLLGGSAGGLIAAEVARRHPEKVHALVLLGVGRPANAIAWRDSLLARTSSHEALLSALFYRPPPSALFVEGAARVLRSPAYKQFLDEEALAFLDGGFARLEVPTLFIHGREDSMTSTEDAAAAAAQVAGASLELVADCGHLPHVEQAAAVASLLERFLAPRLPSQGAPSAGWKLR